MPMAESLTTAKTGLGGGRRHATVCNSATPPIHARIRDAADAAAAAAAAPAVGDKVTSMPYRTGIGGFISLLMRQTTTHLTHTPLPRLVFAPSLLFCLCADCVAVGR